MVFLLFVIAFQTVVVFFRFMLEALLHFHDETRTERERNERSFFFNACLAFYYFCVFIGSIVVCVKGVNDVDALSIRVFAVIAIFAFYNFWKYLYYTLRALELHVVMLVPIYKLRGKYFARMKFFAPYEILYYDGTRNHQVLLRNKKGVLWEYEGKEYLVGLYDFSFKEAFVPKDKLVDKKIFLAAVKDKKLQQSLIMAGGRKMVSGDYYFKENKDTLTGVYLNENGDVKWYEYGQQVSCALIRPIE